ncbi:unnamed protein product, partial [Ilex paraguariensis]
PHQEDEFDDVFDVDILPSLERDHMMPLDHFNAKTILHEGPMEMVSNEDDSFINDDDVEEASMVMI